MEDINKNIEKAINIHIKNLIREDIKHYKYLLSLDKMTDEEAVKYILNHPVP